MFKRVFTIYYGETCGYSMTYQNRCVIVSSSKRYSLSSSVSFSVLSNYFFLFSNEKILTEDLSEFCANCFVRQKVPSIIFQDNLMPRRNSRLDVSLPRVLSQFASGKITANENIYDGTSC